MKKNTNDWQITNELQGIILISFSLVIFKLLLSGQITLILAPKMTPFIVFAMITMFVLGVFRLMNSDMYGADCGCEACDPGGSSFFGLFQYSVLFILPIIISFNLDSYHLSAAALEGRGLNSQVQLEENDDLLHEIMNENDNEIVVTDDNYFKVMHVMNEYMKEMEGTPIKITGFIYREEGFAQNEAVIARQSMSCCVADSSIYGYMLEGKVDNLQTGDWYEASGVIGKREYEGNMMPVIKISHMKKVNPPADVYLYEYEWIVK